MMVMMYSIRTGVIRWQIPDFLSDGNNNVCSVSWDIPKSKENAKDVYDIFVNQEKCKNFDLENEGQGQGE